MKSFFSFLIPPLAIGLALMVSPWLGDFLIERPEPVSVQQLTLPPGIRDITPEGKQSEKLAAIRLEALMPSGVIDHVVPAPAVEAPRPAAERFRLSSVLLAPVRSSAVIDGEVLFEGSRLAEYRLVKIRQDSVALKGPRGTEILALDTGTAGDLFPVARREQGKVRFALPARNPDPAKNPAQLPPEELEKQFRRLLENFSH